jgi:hypothetical protein
MLALFAAAATALWYLDLNPNLYDITETTRMMTCEEIEEILR